MFEIEYAELAAATPDQIWALYTDVAGWPVWDKGIESSRLDGPFEPGTRGALTPQGGQALPFVLSLVEVGRLFEDVTELPGAALIFRHELEGVPGGTRIRHRIGISGPQAGHFASLFGEHLRAGLPPSVTALARLAGVGESV